MPVMATDGPPSPCMPSRRRRALSTALVEAASCSERSSSAARACSKLIELPAAVVCAWAWADNAAVAISRLMVKGKQLNFI